MSLPSTQPHVAGWYPDPAGGVGQRWHDGQGWTGQTSYAKPRQPLGPSFANLSDWLSRLLVLNLVLDLLAIPLILWGRSGDGLLSTLDTPGVVQPGVPQGVAPVTPVTPEVMPEVMPASFYVAVLFLLVLLFVYCLTGLVWLVWQHRTATSAPGALKSSPGMHVVWWFVPVASLWMPVRNISNLWRTYGTARARSAEPVAGPPIFLWWACWIGSSMFAGFAYLALVGGSEQTQTLTNLGIVGAVIQGLAAGLGAFVVRQLSWVALLSHVDAA